MLKLFKGLFIEEEGQGMTEYGLILGAIAVVVIAAVALLGDGIKSMIDEVIAKLTLTSTADATTTTNLN